MKLKFRFDFILLALVGISMTWPALSAQPLSVGYKELDHYWVVSQADMSPVMPPLVRAKQGVLEKRGRVVLDYAVTINEKGVPVDFQFKSITPADVDPKPFIATVMFYRYKPSTENPQHRAVRLHGPLPFFIPK